MANQDFWKKLQDDSITVGNDRLEIEATKLLNLVTWLWAFYLPSSGFILLGTRMANTTYPLWIKISFIVPAVLLVLSHYMCSVATIPPKMSFPLNNLTKFIQAFTDATRVQHRNLYNAKLLVAASVLSMMIVIILASVITEPVKPSISVHKSKSEVGKFVVKYDPGPKMKTFLTVNYFLKNPLLNESFEIDVKDSQPVIAVLANPPDGTEKVVVTLSWKDADTTRSISAEVVATP